METNLASRIQQTFSAAIQNIFFVSEIMACFARGYLNEESFLLRQYFCNHVSVSVPEKKD